MARSIPDALELARRHVAEAEQRVLEQRKRLAKMIEAGRTGQAAVNAKKLLRTFEDTLANMRDHLAMEEGSGRGRSSADPGSGDERPLKHRRSQARNF